jgi:hypothetical protein
LPEPTQAAKKQQVVTKTSKPFFTTDAAEDASSAGADFHSYKDIPWRRDE